MTIPEQEIKDFINFAFKSSDSLNKIELLIKLMEYMKSRPNITNYEPEKLKR
jgi:hypothetical protein